MSELLDVGFAVFNGHKNNAGKRAMEICRQMFGEDNPEFLTLQKIDKEGVMDVFSHHTRAAHAYIALCFTFANELEKIEA